MTKAKLETKNMFFSPFGRLQIYLFIFMFLHPYSAPQHQQDIKMLVIIAEVQGLDVDSGPCGQYWTGPSSCLASQFALMKSEVGRAKCQYPKKKKKIPNFSIYLNYIQYFF